MCQNLFLTHHFMGGWLIVVCSLRKDVSKDTALWAYYFPSWDGTVIFTPARMSYFSSGVPSI